MLTIIFSILGVIAVFLMVVVMRGGGIAFPWVEFYLRGKESGFKFSEINVLRSVAVENRLTEPASLYWSEWQLDRCIRGTITRIRAQGEMDDMKSIRFLRRLFDFRKQVEFNLPKYRSGLRSSRNMMTGQRIRIPIQGVGVFESHVVENMRKYIAIAYPTGKRLPPGYSWRSLKIDVFFWRIEDAEYFFETKVIADYYDKKEPVLHIGHSDNLVRTQKRGSIRLSLTDSASLYPLRIIEAANEIIETRPGYKGKMIDLSEDGFAIKIGGKAKAGLPIKMQLLTNDDYVVICGTVKNVSYSQKTNQSILHVQAVKPSDKMRVTILTLVYGIFSDRRSNDNPRFAVRNASVREKSSEAAEENQHTDDENSD